MSFLLVVAEGDAEFRKTVGEMTGAVRAALPFAIEVREGASAPEIRALLAEWHPDALLLDWNVAAEGTVPFLRQLQGMAPGVRILVMLPEASGEYRRAVWDAGACAGVPRDRLDAECLAAAVCIMQRAKLREAALRSRPTEPSPVCVEVSP